jgi:C4-dicarboxylate-specific signal transduction histidine kinase
MIDLDKYRYLQAVLRDISEKKQTEQELESHRNDLERLVAERTIDLGAVNEELKATNEELSEKNIIIRAQNEELISTLEQLKETQSHLIQAEKMASLGVLTSGVSHEINNPLNFIMGGYLGLESYFREDNRHHNDEITFLLESIKIGIERTGDIVRGLNQFSRDNENFREDCNIPSIIDNCLLILNNQLKGRIVIEKQYNDITLIIPGNIGKLHQLFINILINSIQAIEKAGSITIETFFQGKNFMVEIEDTGKGISRENLKRIMDPFFTTQDPGKGVGLGLYIATTIMQQHNGFINIKSDLNEGTKVTVGLPLARG